MFDIPEHQEVDSQQLMTWFDKNLEKDDELRKKLKILVDKAKEKSNKIVVRMCRYICGSETHFASVVKWLKDLRKSDTITFDDVIELYYTITIEDPAIPYPIKVYRKLDLLRMKMFDSFKRTHNQELDFIKVFGINILGNLSHDFGLPSAKASPRSGLPKVKEIKELPLTYFLGYYLWSHYNSPSEIYRVIYQKFFYSASEPEIESCNHWLVEQFTKDYKEKHQKDPDKDVLDEFLKNCRSGKYDVFALVRLGVLEYSEIS